MRSARVILAILLTSATLPGLSADFVPGRLYIADAAAENCWGPYPDDRDLIWEVDPATGASRIFASVIHPACGVISGLTFTPDGSRLRASNFLQSQILQFDGVGNRSVALGPNDGIYGPYGSNNIAFDPSGNFFAVDTTPAIRRFPAGGGPGQVFAGAAQGITGTSAIAAGISGEIYYAHQGLVGTVIRFSASGEPFTFPPLPSRIGSLTVDDRGDIYVWAGTGVYRYANGNPTTSNLWRHRQLRLVPTGAWLFRPSTATYIWRTSRTFILSTETPATFKRLQCQVFLAGTAELVLGWPYMFRSQCTASY